MSAPEQWDVFLSSACCIWGSIQAMLPFSASLSRLLKQCRKIECTEDVCVSALVVASAAHASVSANQNELYLWYTWQIACAHQLAAEVPTYFTFFNVAAGSRQSENEQLY